VLTLFADDRIVRIVDGATMVAHRQSDKNGVISGG
jgi:hypothetical protein